MPAPGLIGPTPRPHVVPTTAFPLAWAGSHLPQQCGTDRCRERFVCFFVFLLRNIPIVLLFQVALAVSVRAAGTPAYRPRIPAYGALPRLFVCLFVDLFVLRRRRHQFGDFDRLLVPGAPSTLSAPSTQSAPSLRARVIPFFRSSCRFAVLAVLSAVAVGRAHGRRCATNTNTNTNTTARNRANA